MTVSSKVVSTASVLLLALSASALATPVTDTSGRPQSGSDQAFVCVKHWGVRNNRGFCGLARPTDDGRLAIRILRINRTVLRTSGNACSGGLNLKDLVPGIELRIPPECVTAGRT
ncbi:MAG: hypothetical protein ACFCUN_01420 [Hyphomicrobiaceae bacterium]